MTGQSSRSRQSFCWLLANSTSQDSPVCVVPSHSNPAAEPHDLLWSTALASGQQAEAKSAHALCHLRTSTLGMQPPGQASQASHEKKSHGMFQISSQSYQRVEKANEATADILLSATIELSHTKDAKQKQQNIHPAEPYTTYIIMKNNKITFALRQQVLGPCGVP